MKKAFIIIIVLTIVSILFWIPNPHRVKDGGSIFWSPIVPVYEVRIYHTRPNPILGGSMRGYAVDFFGVEVIDQTYIEPCE